MLQDIYPEKLDNHYAQLPPEDFSYLVILHEQKILLHCTPQSISLPLFRTIKDAHLSTTYLLSAGNHSFFLVTDWENEDGIFATGFAVNVEIY